MSENKSAVGKFYGVGLGPGDPDLITVKTLKILQNADRIFTVGSRQTSGSLSQSIIAALPGVTAPLDILRFAMSKDRLERQTVNAGHAKSIAGYLRRGENCVFACIGDPMTYGTCSYLLRNLRAELPGLAVEIVPGVNSWSALAAQLQEPLVEDCEILRIVPSFESPETLELPADSTTVLLKSYRSRNELLQKIPTGAKIAYGENLTLKHQLLSRNPDEIAALPDAYLSMLAVWRKAEEPS